MGTGTILLVNPKLRSNYNLLPFTGAMIVVGAWIDKGFGMISSGSLPSPLHHVTEYTPTVP